MRVAVGPLGEARLRLRGELGLGLRGELRLRRGHRAKRGRLVLAAQRPPEAAQATPK